MPGRCGTAFSHKLQQSEPQLILRLLWDLRHTHTWTMQPLSLTYHQLRHTKSRGRSIPVRQQVMTTSLGGSSKLVLRRCWCTHLHLQPLPQKKCCSHLLQGHGHQSPGQVEPSFILNDYRKVTLAPKMKTCFKKVKKSGVFYCCLFLLPFSLDRKA